MFPRWVMSITRKTKTLKDAFHHSRDPSTKLAIILLVGRRNAADRVARDTRRLTTATRIKAARQNGARVGNRTTLAPAAVATPLPPRKPAKTGKTWPSTAAAPHRTGAVLPGSDARRATRRTARRPFVISFLLCLKRRAAVYRTPTTFPRGDIFCGIPSTCWTCVEHRGRLRFFLSLEPGYLVVDSSSIRILATEAWRSGILLMTTSWKVYSQPLTASPMISRLRGKARFRYDVPQKITTLISKYTASDRTRALLRSSKDSGVRMSAASINASKVLRPLSNSRRRSTSESGRHRPARSIRRERRAARRDSGAGL